MLKRSYVSLLSLTSIVAMLFSYGFAFLLTMQSDNRYEWMKAENVVQLPVDTDSPERVRMYIYLTVLFVLISLVSGFFRHKNKYFKKGLFWISLLPLFYVMWRYFGLVNA